VPSQAKASALSSSRGWANNLKKERFTLCARWSPESPRTKILSLGQKCLNVGRVHDLAPSDLPSTPKVRHG